MFVDDRKGGFLVRNGDVATAEASRADAAQEAPEGRGRDVDRLIPSLDAERAQPMSVDERRPGVGDRMAAHEGLGEVLSHRSPQAPEELPEAAAEAVRRW